MSKIFRNGHCDQLWFDGMLRLLSTQKTTSKHTTKSQMMYYCLIDGGPWLIDALFKVEETLLNLVTEWWNISESPSDFSSLFVMCPPTHAIKFLSPN